VCHWPLSYECVVEEKVAEYDAEGLVVLKIEDVELEVVLNEGDVVDDVSTEVVFVMTVLDELKDGVGDGTTMVTGGEFTSMTEYPVVVTVAGGGVIVTTTVWTVPDSSMVFVEMM
jgi:hypothetical protein